MHVRKSLATVRMAHRTAPSEISRRSSERCRAARIYLARAKFVALFVEGTGSSAGCRSAGSDPCARAEEFRSLGNARLRDEVTSPVRKRQLPASKEHLGLLGSKSCRDWCSAVSKGARPIPGRLFHRRGQRLSSQASQTHQHLIFCIREPVNLT